jgi:hypothetical protein
MLSFIMLSRAISLIDFFCLLAGVGSIEQGLALFALHVHKVDLI